MTTHARGTIPCTVGILTYNSEAFLERCLLGLSDFSEVLVADGGSTDSTLEIARRYGCRVIQQSNPGHPISDFACERNRMVDAASNDWFLSLDSDELITKELVEDIRSVTTGEDDGVYVYRIPYRIVSQDLRTVYASFKTYYQHRFFNRKSGARYTRKVHERITFDENCCKQGTLSGAWHVPLDIQLDFSIYKQKVDHRIRIMVAERPPGNLVQYLRRMSVDPMRNVAKQSIKLVWLRMRYPSRRLTPLRYEAYKLYSQLVFMKEATRQYLRSLRPYAKLASYALAYAVRLISRAWDHRPEVTILMYHAVDRSGSKLAVTPRVFEEQLAYLKRAARVVPLSDVVSFARGNMELSGRTVAITFDDAYEDIFSTVTPLLRKYGFPATIFVPTQIDAPTDPAHTPRLSWDQIGQLSAEPLLEFESHGRTHRALTKLDDEDLTDELSGSKGDLEQKLGTTVRYVAYPYGARNGRVEEAAARAGYEAALSITEGTVNPGDQLYSLRRVQVDSTISPQLFSWRTTRAMDIQRAVADWVRSLR